jgi:SAM-dependent methyltransferase
MKDNGKYFKTNLRRWNELVEINAKSKFYDLDGFKSGKSSLFPIEREEIGNVDGKTLLHLQCHFGMDTLSFARLGAKVTGVDFSDKAIKLARQLSEELNIPAKFIKANIYDIPDILHDKFDIVFTSNGAIGWLPDLYKWAEIIDYCLKPGGTFYITENHPFGNLIDEKYDNAFQVGYDYFNDGKPYRFDEDDGAYVDPNIKLQNFETYDWFHPMGDVINSLLKVNFELEFLHEFPFSFFQIHPDMKQNKETKYWEFQTLKHSVPMIFSIKAHKIKTNLLP